MHLQFLLVTLLAALPVPAKGPPALCDHVAADIDHVLDCGQQEALAVLPEAPQAYDADNDEDSSDLRRRVAQSQHDSPRLKTPAVADAVSSSLPGRGCIVAAPSPRAARAQFLSLGVPRARAQLPDPAPIA